MDHHFCGDHNGARKLNTNTTKKGKTDMNAGFSAPVNYWGTITGLTPTDSQDGATSSLAEAPDKYGDTAYFDVYGEKIAPSTTFAVEGEVDLSDIVLGSIHSIGTSGNVKKVMLTNVQINTQAGTPPTVTISGVQVEATATAARTYELEGTLLPRSIAQDVFGALTDNDAYTTINSTASIDPHTADVKGVPVASDASHGKIEVQVTLTDGAGTETITPAQDGGFTITSVPASSNPDSNYITRTATLTKFIDGTEATTTESQGA